MDARVHIGTASWTDPTLLRAGFYPAAARTPESRLRFYTAHFDTVEVDSTYYALPSERNAMLWAARSPDDFRFHIKAFALLTQHAAEIRTLPLSVRELLPAAARRELRLQRPAPEILALCFDMFRTALQPLRTAGKLGCILLQFPPWFVADTRHAAYVERCRAELPEDRLAVELRHSSWFNGRTESTLDFLAAHDLSLVCIDAPIGPSIARPPFRTTTAVAYVRLHGRNRRAWFQRSGTAAQRFKYLYSDDELRECAARIRGLHDAREIHVIFNNCYGDYGVRNASTMQRLLQAH